jgi:hypothetical protein
MRYEVICKLLVKSAIAQPHFGSQGRPQRKGRQRRISAASMPSLGTTTKVRKRARTPHAALERARARQAPPERLVPPIKCKVRLYAGFCPAGRPAVAIIRLGAHSRARSSHLPAASPSRVVGCLFGVAARRDCPFHPDRHRSTDPTRLCCSDPHLTVGRCYLLRRSAQSGRSSRGKPPPAIARRTLQLGI